MGLKWTDVWVVHGDVLWCYQVGQRAGGGGEGPGRGLQVVHPGSDLRGAGAQEHLGVDHRT